jgi:hypothetical protein
LGFKPIRGYVLDTHNVDGFWQWGQIWLLRWATMMRTIVVLQRGQARPVRRNTFNWSALRPGRLLAE